MGSTYQHHYCVLTLLRSPNFCHFISIIEAWLMQPAARHSTYQQV